MVNKPIIKRIVNKQIVIIQIIVWVRVFMEAIPNIKMKVPVVKAQMFPQLKTRQSQNTIMMIQNN